MNGASGGRVGAVAGQVLWMLSSEMPDVGSGRSGCQRGGAASLGGG